MFRLLTLLSVLCLLPAIVLGDDGEKNAEQTIDDARQAGTIGARRGNWVAVPIPVANPTVGAGLQAVLMYLHPKPEDETSPHNPTSGLGAMYTNTGSWFVGAFHDDSWDKDRYRFTGFIGTGEFNLRYYGIGGDSFFGQHPVDYGLGTSIGNVQLQVRVPWTDHWYAGLSYLYLDSEVVFRTSDLSSQLPDIRDRIQSAGLGLVATYDSRDDNYYPTRGQYLQAQPMNFDETWGGDFDFNKLKLSAAHYQPLADRLVLALYTRFESSSGDVPFFQLSTLAMRGFARDRYLADTTLSVHAEGRYKFLPRWGLVVFLESGWYGDDPSGLGDNPTVTSYGAGVRWQATAQQRLNLGVDVAFSNDDYVAYIRIGEAF